MAVIYATKSPEMSEREKRNMERSRKIATQGMVLLENDGTLPIRSANGKIALFGSGARRTIKGGIGSGDVNSRMTVNVEQGLQEAGFTVTTSDWMDRHDRACEESMGAYMKKFNAAIEERGAAAIMEVLAAPHHEPDEPLITQDDIACAETDTVIYVIARNSGEGKDRTPTPGDYELSENEQKNLETIASAFKKTIVVLNVGGVVDTKVIRNMSGINAILLMSQAGNISGYALADILTGKETPSGHLTTTWAENYTDYPSAATFSHMNQNLDDEYYEEGIYVGYRYFDTFGVTPAYPFGYGLSYTSFTTSTERVTVEDNQVKVVVEVKNTGSDFAGKEVVQVYYSAPDGKLEKPYQELAGYGKTGLLQPGETQKLEITFPVAFMASYDEERASYILEAGDYIIRVGSHSRNTHVAAVLHLDGEAVTEVLSNRIRLTCELTTLSSKDATPYSYAAEAEEKKNALKVGIKAADIATKPAPAYQGVPAAVQGNSEETVTLDMVWNGEVSLDDLVAQLTVEELAELCVGASRGGFGSASVIGAASTACPGAAGDTTSSMIESRKIPNIVLADGPAGLRLSRTFVADADNNVIPGLGESALGGLEKLFGAQVPERPADAVDYYQYCTAIPIATLLAQTWDLKAIEDAGDIVGEEMEEFGVALWLAPGMNIHRNPLCGRNFEYYSEDPLISGKCAVADTKGVQKHPGRGTTIKHFALNNQEDNRTNCNENCTERAIREIYLKGFEIAVKESQPLALMTSYNLLNGVHTANNYDLLTAICREEWGFEGMIMTDWGTTGGGGFDSSLSRKYGLSSAAGCIKAGNDLTMPGSTQDLEEIVHAVSGKEDQLEYPLTMGELQACAKRVLQTIIKCVHP